MWMLQLWELECRADLVCLDVNGVLAVLFIVFGAILVWPPFVERLRPRRKR